MEKQIAEKELAQESQPRIGMDESGKGDYFGPLVACAVYVDNGNEIQLQELGVRDSKKLSDNRIIWLARNIKTATQYSVVQIGPKRYNQLYQRFGNLNYLLSWAHARALENVLEKKPCGLAIADKFGEDNLLLNALMKKGKQIELIQRVRGEEDVAVATASILARAEFLWGLKRLSKKCGYQLPKGGSNSSIIEVGISIIESGGIKKLSEVAKLHFNTTSSIKKREGICKVNVV